MTNEKKRTDRLSKEGLYPKESDFEMKVIAFINQKGGAGKTTGSEYVGMYLAERGYRVLLIDTDPQCNLSYGMDYDPVLNKVLDGKPTLVNVIASDNPGRTIRNAMYQIQMFKKKPVWLVPSSYNLGDEVDHIMFKARVDVEKYDDREMMDNLHNSLRDAIFSIKDYFDFVIIDCYPQIYGTIFKIVMKTVDEIVFPIDGFQALLGLEKLSDQLKRYKGKYNGNIYISRYHEMDKRPVTSKYGKGKKWHIIHAFLSQFFGHHFCLNTISNQVAILRGFAGIPTSLMGDPNRQFRDLTNELLAKWTSKEKNFFSDFRESVLGLKNNLGAKEYNEELDKLKKVFAERGKTGYPKIKGVLWKEKKNVVEEKSAKEEITIEEV